MESLQEVLAEQEAVMHSIRQTTTNLKKLGKEKITEAVLRPRIASLEENFKTCRSRHAAIVAHCDSKTKAALQYFTEDQFATAEDAYNEAADFMAELLAQRAATPGPPSEASTRKSDRLPRLRLPQFDGNFDQWESFRDKFTSMILNDPTVSQVDRIQHLSSCVTGEAAKAINHIALTEGNFQIAWKILVSRYENKRRLITQHLSTLTELPRVTRETADQLRDLRDRVNGAIQALVNLNRPVNHWDDMLVYLVSQRLDIHTRKSWEIELGDTVEYPPFSKLSNFLDARIRALECMADQPDKSTRSHVNQPLKQYKSMSSHSVALSASCPLCHANHLIIKCDAFRNKSPEQRIEIIRNSNRCLNCFSAKHLAKDCANKHACKQCNRRHHTLLHIAPQAVTPTATKIQTSAASTADYGHEPVHAHLTARAPAINKQVLLATARVRVYSPSGYYLETRALLDQGSAVTIVTERLVQSLRLPKRRCDMQISGVGDNATTVRHVVDVTISPTFAPTPEFSTAALVLRTLTRYVPPRESGSPRWPHVANLQLADTAPLSNDPIDLLIGADLYGSLLLDGICKGDEGHPIAQRSALGWIVSGLASTSRRLSNGASHHSTVTRPIHVLADDTSAMEALNGTLRLFWEVEDLPTANSLTEEEQRAEQHFASTHARTQGGRYIVRLPFKAGPPNLGASRPAALSRLTHVEQKLARDPKQRDAYHAFMAEYVQLGHMEEKDPNSRPHAERHYYIPHHAVIKDSSGTTPLRVVFNASCRASSGQSLNDHLWVGPKLQNDLHAILLRWRHCRYVYTADSAKMYRQILVDPRDRDYQLILWRAHSNAPVSEHRLCTVTYGTASAAYQAQRVLRQLAEDEGAAYPLATQVIREQTYVDDFIFGADEFEVALSTRDQLNALLGKGGFRLRKWASNCPALLAGIDRGDHGLAHEKTFEGVEHLKVLGVAWNPSEDALKFRVSASNETTTSTSKRTVMAIIARLFDPLGVIAPTVIAAKIMLQQLWLAKCAWDDPLPSKMQRAWDSYYESLPALHTLTIPRSSRTSLSLVSSTISLHYTLMVESESASQTNIALRTDEIQSAKALWIRKMQNDGFPSELTSLSKGNSVPLSSSISSLNPFLDHKGIMRVGGRLRRSNLPERAIHPVLLRSHPILTMLVAHHHLRTLHGGSALTLSSLRDEYWIVRGRTTVRSVLHRCVTCARDRAVVPRELMGDLPAIRTNRTQRAFVHTGVDYAGPILVRNAAGRGHASHKAYISLFICMTTKAVHLELVHDYGSAAFLAAFHRFVSRRGIPSSMYSDNGTTFQGTERALVSAHRHAIRDPALLNALATDQVTWHFIPPAAPHFGGLWEAGVKSAKRHLRKCVGRHTLTAEELTTVLCRIEACLNSRPIAAVSEHLEDYAALTPGHFLIGAPLIAAPEPSVLHLREQRLSRWQLTQRLTELVWRAWRSEYLHTLYQRPKWRSVQRLAAIGRLVILRHEALPPTHWEMGRIVACHPGADGLTRVVTVRTARTTYKRPLAKICFLPVDINQEEETESSTAPSTAGGGTAGTDATGGGIAGGGNSCI